MVYWRLINFKYFNMITAEELLEKTTKAIMKRKDEPFYKALHSIENALEITAKHGGRILDVTDHVSDIWLLSDEHLERLVDMLERYKYNVSYEKDYLFFIEW